MPQFFLAPLQSELISRLARKIFPHSSMQILNTLLIVWVKILPFGGQLQF